MICLKYSLLHACFCVIGTSLADCRSFYYYCREKPLHINVFSKSQSVTDEFVSRTSSGGLSANDCMVFKVGRFVQMLCEV